MPYVVPASLNSDDCPEGEFHNAPHDVPATPTVRERVEHRACHKTAFERLIGARKDLNAREEADGDKIYAEYFAKISQITQHDTEARLKKCGCQ
jgi:hypothetical protein